jgi:hypothetical protein
MDDDISKKTKEIYKNAKWKGIGDKTLRDKFEENKGIVGQLGGENSWTNEVYNMDINSYKLEDIIIPTIREIIEGKYHTDISRSDKIYGNNIKFILRNIWKDEKKTEDDGIEWFIVNNREILYRLLEYRSLKRQSLSTLNQDLKTICRVMKITYGEKDELYMKYSILQSDLNNVIINREVGNNVIKKDNYIGFEEILKIREELEKEFRKKLSERTKNDKEVKRLHYYMLLLSAYTLTSPTRLEVMTLKVVVEREEMKEESIDYVYIPKEGDAEYVLNGRKKGHKSISYVVGFDERETRKLSDILRETIKLYPREWLFPRMSDWRERATTQTISKYLGEILEEKKITVNMVRSSYASWRHNNNLDFNSLQDDAVRQRNTVKTQLQHYRKKEEKGEEKGKITEVKVNIKGGGRGFDRKEYGKNYYEENKERINEKNRERWRKDVRMKALKNIRLYNRKEGRPSKRSIEKYELYEEGGEWKTRL